MPQYIWMAAFLIPPEFVPEPDTSRIYMSHEEPSVVSGKVALDLRVDWNL